MMDGKPPVSVVQCTNISLRPCGEGRHRHPDMISKHARADGGDTWLCHNIVNDLTSETIMK